jgi:hypothetical protein
MKQIIFLLCLSTLTVFLFDACKKEVDSNDQAITQDLISISDLGIQADLEAGFEVSFDSMIPMTGCPTYSFSQQKGTWPNIITIDYSDAGCSKPDGRTIKGKLLVNQSGSMKNYGTKRTITFSDFSINGVKIDGSRTQNFYGFYQTAGVMLFYGSSDLTMTYPNGSKSFASSTDTMKMSNMLYFYETADQVSWSYASTGKGTSHNGEDYTYHIDNAFKSRNCLWLSNGTAEFKIGNTTRTVTLGKDCDSKAVLKQGDGNSFSVKAHHWWQ